MIQLPIFELIEYENFRKQTAMFIGEKRLGNLRTFMDGYFYALDVNNIDSEIQLERFYGFHDWIANYFGWKESTAGWVNIILKECNGDESKAVDKFFELYDEFLNGNEMSIKNEIII